MKKVLYIIYIILIVVSEIYGIGLDTSWGKLFFTSENQCYNNIPFMLDIYDGSGYGYSINEPEIMRYNFRTGDISCRNKGIYWNDYKIEAGGVLYMLNHDSNCNQYLSRYDGGSYLKKYIGGYVGYTKINYSGVYINEITRIGDKLVVNKRSSRDFSFINYAVGRISTTTYYKEYEYNRVIMDYIMYGGGYVYALVGTVKYDTITSTSEQWLSLARYICNFNKHEIEMDYIIPLNISLNRYTSLIYARNGKIVIDEWYVLKDGTPVERIHVFSSSGRYLFSRSYRYDGSGRGLFQIDTNGTNFYTLEVNMRDGKTKIVKHNGWVVTDEFGSTKSFKALGRYVYGAGSLASSAYGYVTYLYRYDEYIGNPELYIYKDTTTDNQIVELGNESEPFVVKIAKSGGTPVENINVSYNSDEGIILSSQYGLSDEKGISSTTARIVTGIPKEYHITATCEVCSGTKTVTFTCCGKLPNDDFKQYDVRWADNKYDSTNKTIRQVGCALSVLATLSNYYKTKFNISIPKTDPNRLNKYLISIGTKGYRRNGNLNWASIDRFSNNYIIFRDLINVDEDHSIDDLIKYADDEIFSGRPIVFRIRRKIRRENTEIYSTHFVLGIGKCGEDYIISDPGNDAKIKFNPRDPDFTLTGIRRFIIKEGL